MEYLMLSVALSDLLVVIPPRQQAKRQKSILAYVTNRNVPESTLRSTLKLFLNKCWKLHQISMRVVQSNQGGLGHRVSEWHQP
jgi:hypothetical protein